MALILNIDTAVETASVCLSNDEVVLQTAANTHQRDHAAWLHPAIDRLMNDAGKHINQLEAIAVTIGPGSYTGLRVGLSTAKGLCYALKVPLIAINTLEVMAYACRKIDTDLYCPLIDARRMEVFMAVYNKQLFPIIEPKTLIVVTDSFDNLLQSNKIVFCGNGAVKTGAIIHHSNALFTNIQATAADMPHFSHQYFIEKKFSDLAYTEPLYIKEFYSPVR